MAKAEISISQSNSGLSSTPGKALRGLTIYAGAGDEIEFANSADGDIGAYKWQWTLIERPPGSAASLVGATGNSCTLNADVYGRYVVSLRVNGLSDDSEGYAVTVAGVSYPSLGAASGGGNLGDWDLPAYNERDFANWLDHFGPDNPYGAQRELYRILKQIREDIAPGGGGSPLEVQDEGIQIDPATTVIDFIGAGVTVTSAGAGAVDVTIPGGGGGGAQAPTLIIGNSAMGDSASDCDFLYDGTNGALLRAAIEGVAVGTDIYIRPGSYDLAAGGGPFGPLLIPAGVNVVGAGMECVTIKTVYDDPRAATLGTGACLRDLTFLGADDPTGVVFQMPGSMVDLGIDSRCIRVRVEYENSWAGFDPYAIAVTSAFRTQYDGHSWCLNCESLGAPDPSFVGGQNFVHYKQDSFSGSHETGAFHVVECLSTEGTLAFETAFGNPMYVNGGSFTDLSGFNAAALTASYSSCIGAAILKSGSFGNIAQIRTGDRIKFCENTVTCSGSGIAGFDVNLTEASIVEGNVGQSDNVGGGVGVNPAVLIGVSGNYCICTGNNFRDIVNGSAGTYTDTGTGNVLANNL